MMLRACAAILPLALLGLAECSSGPVVVLDTPLGVAPIYSPQPAMPGGAITPPPGMAQPTPTDIAARTGSYTGTAFPLDTGGGNCVNTLTVSNFHVHGNAVRFGGFHGTVDSDNGLQMAYGNEWVVGQFEGPTFHGQLDRPGGKETFGCTYMLTLQRTGP